MTAALATAVGALAMAAAAPAKTPLPGNAAPVREPLLWATVNVCDTSGYPDGVGIRGSMPGSDRRDAMFMRLQVQFQRGDGRWMPVARGGDSGFIPLGHGGVRARQSGQTFTVTPPGAGRPAFVLRGLVTFEWRRNGVVQRRARRLTSGGHPGTPGADPLDFSAATCSVM